MKPHPGKGTETPPKPFLWFRKAYHVVNSSMVPVYYAWNPFDLPLGTVRFHVLAALAAGFLFFITFDLLRLNVKSFNDWVLAKFSFIIRQAEAKRLTGATYMCPAFFAVTWFFEWRIAVASMLFISVGDTAAEVGGRFFGRHRIERFHKSWEGTFAFFLVTFPIAWVLLGDWRVAALGAAVGAFTELVTTVLDDNLTVPVASALALWAASALAGPL
jgi:dolichol kinase